MIVIKGSNKFPLFHFMPRTSATTLTRAIRAAYNFNPNNLSNLQSIDKKYKFIKENIICNDFLSVNDISIIDENNNKILTTGHYASQFYKYHKNPLLFFTLRHPVERIISHYKVRKKWVKYSLHDIFIKNRKQLIDNYPNNIDRDKLLYVAFHGNIPWTSNFYCQALFGHSLLKADNFPVTEDIYNKIIDNLNDFTVEFKDISGKKTKIPIVIGITESNFNTLNLFSHIMDWNLDIDKFYQQISKVQDRHYSDFTNVVNAEIEKELSNDVIDAICDCNKYDIKLYNVALKLFKEQFVNIEYKPNTFNCKYIKTKLII